MGTSCIAFSDNNIWRGSKGLVRMVLKRIHAESAAGTYWHSATTADEIEVISATTYWSVSETPLPELLQLYTICEKIGSHWDEFVQGMEPLYASRHRTQFEDLVTRLKKHIEHLQLNA